MNPEVSIIIAAYNCENYLARALEPVLAQTYDNFEIIVIDDASTDSTLQVARSFRDSRLKIIANQQNLGMSKVPNDGIQKARGNWIALLDSDDWYAPEPLEKLLQVVADDLFLINDREQYPWGILLKENKLHPYYYYPTREISHCTRTLVQYLAQSCQIFRRFIDLELAKNNQDKKAIAALNKNLKIFSQGLYYHQAMEYIRQKILMSIMV